MGAGPLLFLLAPPAAPAAACAGAATACSDADTRAVPGAGRWGRRAGSAALPRPEGGGAGERGKSRSEGVTVGGEVGCWRSVVLSWSWTQQLRRVGQCEVDNQGGVRPARGARHSDSTGKHRTWRWKARTGQTLADTGVGCWNSCYSSTGLPLTSSTSARTALRKAPAAQRNGSTIDRWIRPLTSSFVTVGHATP